jgi:YD repeat-containing protein
VGRHSPSSYLFRFHAAVLIAAIAAIAPGAASATVVTSAGNIPYSGISPGGVNMATGELILVMRPDLAIDGPFPVVFRRYYASMLAREGLASGHLGPNWLGTYDWSLSVTTPMVNVITNRGQRIQFQQNPVGGYDLVQPTDQKYQLAFVGGMWRLTDPLRRRIYFFDGTSHLLAQIFDEHGNSQSLIYTGGRLTQVSDGLGRTLQFSYEPTTGLLSLVSDGARSVQFFYTGGVLTGAMDAAGQTWTYAYIQPGPSQGLLTGITEPLGNTPFTQQYDPLGRVMSQTDAQGHISTYTFDLPSGSVFSDGLGNPWTYQHDTLNRLMTRTDPMGGPTSFAYDPLGRPSMVMRPLDDMTTFDYDPASGYTSRMGFADGTAANSTYGSHIVAGATLFDLSTVGYADGTMESYGRDAAGNLNDFMDRGGFHWQGTYNTRGQVLTATNPAGGVTTFTYDPQGRPATETDNARNTTTFFYDPLSRLTETSWPDATHQDYAYNNLDELTSFTDERGKLWSYAYDVDGRPMTETDPLMEASGLIYDDMDRVTQDVDALGHARIYAYDPAGRLQSITDRTGRTTSYQYDTVGRLSGIQDPAGGTTSYFYDGNSRVQSVQDALGHSSSFGYDAMDRVLHMTDPVGTGFDYGYDTMGRILTASAPLGRTEQFGYDPRGLLTSYFDVTSETDLSRTSLGEVQQLTDPNRNGWPAAYDPQGRPTSAADPLTRATTYEYDPLSRPIHIGRPDGSARQITYDPAGRVTGESYTDGTSFTYSYDDANRLTGATGASFAYDAAGRMISSNGFGMTYDNEGRITSETLAPGKVVSYSYNSRGLLSQMQDWLGGTTSFDYDAAQRLTGITRANGTTATYAYDNADRLINSVESQPGPISTPLSSISITRDALGQPTSIDRHQPLMPAVTSPGTTGFAYDPASQVEGFSYDPLGRLVGDGSRSFQWDGASRLTHYVAGADSPRFTYDAFGSALSQTQGGNPAVQQAWNYGRGYPTNDDMQVNLPPSRTSFNVRAPSGVLLYSIDGSNGARSFYHYDENGNTSFLTNDAGSVVTEYSYSPVGGVTGLGQTASNPFTYNAAAGALQLGSSGLFREGGRIYDATNTAVISGPGDEIYTDKYGRVKVQFHWDRQGSKDPVRSAWIQVGRKKSGGDSKPGGAPFLIYSFGTVFTTKVDWKHDDDGPTESITFEYGALGTKYTKQDGGGVNDPSSWPVGPTIAVNDDMPVPLPPWRRGQASAAMHWSNGSGLAEVFGNDPMLSLGGNDTNGDGLRDPWETSQSADLNSSGAFEYGGGGGEGKAHFHEITIHKPHGPPVSVGSSVLLQACATGVHLKEAPITHRHASDPSAHLRLTRRWIPPWED